MKSTDSLKKKVIMLIVDTLMDSSLQAAVKEGKAPALQFFIEKGCYISNLISPFPTMSVNVDSTLLTGVACDQHKIPGLVWYNQAENRIVNYGSHVRELYKLGLKQSMKDIFYNLNHEHLSKQHKTIHETLNEKGIQTATINALLYRGNNPCRLKIPFLLSLITGLKREMDSYSPDLFSYGRMHHLNPNKKKAFFWQRYGFNDKFTSNEMSYLIRENKLPAFTIAYFPDLDQSVHKHGRKDVKGVQKVDEELQNILNQFNSWESALNDNIWIILGDNGQAWTDADRNETLIDLRKLLNQYRIVKLSKGIKAEDEIVLGVNQRMSYIYTLNPEKVPLTDIVQIMRTDKRIDVIAQKNRETVTVISGINDGELHFYPEGKYMDEYGKSWHVEGNFEILDLEIVNNNIKYGNYPDALARLYAPFLSHSGDFIMVSANRGYEFIGEGSPKHVAGASHGGLHKQDSLVSMIICGTESQPKHLRIVDIKDWLLTLIY
ncbi:alkaline phosphatase family protein [Bacillus sp. Marseille-P3661]|uniref:alkaline phosphatase family protein n=1 Tax=Bacillus sp. Marseille-P3661 TaxID=1936234 RepID=UPI000C81E2B4|nr:alkaline phosphatase family protein [Bacillus sp. Marseille-P3661]